MKRHLHIVAIAAITGALAAGAVQSMLSALAVQNELVPPTTGIFTGPQFSQKIGDAFRSLASCQKGSVAPANVGGSTVDGLCWIDDSVTPWVLKRYVNGGWAVEGAFDPSTSSYAGLIGGGLGSVASAATADLNLAPQANVTITGTTTISSFGSASPAGVVKFIRFAGILTLTNSSSLTVPGGFDLTTAANDRAIVTHLGSGNWEITQYTRTNGIPIDVAAVGKTEFTQAASVPSLHVAGYGQALLRASYPAYFAKTTRAQSGTRTSGNATITAIADTSGLGAGMPVESTGVNAGCTIASVVANTSITLNSSACVTSSGTSTLTVFPHGYGTGGGATTVGVDDCRNKVLAGRDRNDPGSLANLLTSSYFGANSGLYGAVGGLESVTMAAGNLIAHTHNNTLTDPGHNHTTASQFDTRSNGNGLGFGYYSNTGGGASLGVLSNTTGISINNASAGSVSPTPMRTVQPTLIAECVVRVIP
jgi:hypothetical protein